MADTIKQKLKDLRKQMTDLRKEMQKTSKEVFQQFSKDLFEKHTNLVSFSWTQYTPYFNDGDTCTFGVNLDEPDMVFKINGEEVEVEGYEMPSDEKWDSTLQKSVPVILTAEEKQQVATYNAVKKFLSNFSEDDLEPMFGDHARVIVTAKGVEVEEYEHD